MLEFLGLLLALVLALAPNAQSPNVAPEDIIARIEEKINHVEAPQDKASEHVGLEITKVLTYNTESEKVVGEVPQVAGDNAPPLVPCTPELCPLPTPTPTPTPTSTPPVIVPIPDPEPIPDPFPGPCPFDTPGNPKPLIFCPLDL